MIDQELIVQETLNIQSSIKSRSTTAITGLWTCCDVLSQTSIDKLKSFIDRTQPDEWQTVDRQETLNRRKIAWQSDTVVEEIHTAFEANTDLINLLFPERQKRFLGLQLWKDWSGYALAWHADNDLIDVSMQIYLFDNDEKLGTTFAENGQTVVIPYRNNSGYLAKNTKSLLHKTSQVTPADVTRYSLYAVWSHS